NRATSRVAVAGWAGDDADSIQSGIDDGSLPGVSLDNDTALAVGTRTGVQILDARSLGTIKTFATTQPVGGLDIVQRGLEKPTIYAATGRQLITIELPGDAAPPLAEAIPLPNVVEQV